MPETIYSNHVAVVETETEVILDIYLRAFSGKPAHMGRVILPPLTAAKLGHLLTPQPDDPIAEQPTLEPVKPKPKRVRKPKAGAT